MMITKKILAAFSLIGVAMLAVFQPTMVKAQSPKGDSAFTIAEDDPVISMLDNMITLEHFKSSSFTTDTSILNVYNFDRDSVPVYSDEVYAYRMKQLNNRTPFNLVYNQAVKNYIDAYAIKNKQKVAQLLGKAEMYFPMMEEILDRYEMPLELKYLAIVESALSPKARSRSGAVGLWQFLYRTGKIYNLNVTSYIDERSDPYLATIAACEYMKYLYNMFGNWELALAAYNGGPGTLNKAIRRSGGKMDYWALRPYLPVETRGYVPAFIAVNYIMNYASAHNIFPERPLILYYEIDTVHIKEKVTFESLSASLEIPVEHLEDLNPMYKRQLIPKGYKHMPLVLPREKAGLFVTNEEAIYALNNNPVASNSTSQTVQSEVKHIHRVQRGENLSLIASRYKCTVDDIKIWNNLRGSLINEGQKLVVYVNERHKVSESTASSSSSSKSNSGSSQYHTVQPGDTLWGIAKQNNITVAELLKLNNMGQNEPLKIGSRLKIG